MMKQVKKVWKRVWVLFCVLLTLPGVASAAQTPVNTAVPLGLITDTASAVEAVHGQAEAMASLGALKDVSDARYLGLYAETAMAQSEIKAVSGNSLTINAEIVNERGSVLQPYLFERELREAMEAQDMEPFESGILNVTAVFRMENPNVSLTIEPDVVNVTSVDTVMVQMPFYNLSFRPFDLKDDLHQTLRIALRNVSDTMDPLIEVRILDNASQNIAHLAGFLRLSLPTEGGDAVNMTIKKVESEDDIVSSYNDVTNQVEGKINMPGIYTPAQNGKKFSDIDVLSEDRQDAVLQLSSQGIIGGYSDGTFRPYASVNRGQFVKIIMNTVGKVNYSLRAQYEDVPSSAYYSPHAATAQKLGYMEGYSDGLFHAERTLNKAQICTIMGRILMKEKKYRPTNRSEWLGKYDDEIPEYAQDSVAVLTRLEILDASNRQLGAYQAVSRIEIIEMVKRMLKYI